MEEVTPELNIEEWELARQGEREVHSRKRLARARHVHISLVPESVAKDLFLYRATLILIWQGLLRFETGKCLKGNSKIFCGFVCLFVLRDTTGKTELVKDDDTFLGEKRK